MNNELSQRDFKLLKDYIYSKTGINLKEEKISLLKSRLNKRLRALNINSFKKYYDYLVDSEDEYTNFVNAVSTNVTSFFREEIQWNFLEKEIGNIIARTQGKLRIWSAASSTGEEAYSVGIFLKDNLKNLNNYDIKILATDISHDALTKAKLGIYQEKAIQNLKRYQVSNNFSRIGKTNQYIINKDLKDLVMFREFNLVYGDYNIFGEKKFDIIFCRNVIIYFDNKTKIEIINNLIKKLKKGGYFFLGHSESLMSQKGLKYIMPSIYQKL
ncbi:MAG: CheR family methyltransferase [Campylobacterota bacterium]